MAVKISEIAEALDFVSGGDGFGNEAYVNRGTGQVVLVSDEFCDLEDRPDDLDSDEWVMIPQKADLDLGAHLAYGFIGEFIPDKEAIVRGIFQKKGAYGRFKELLDEEGLLERWYEYEDAKRISALREWCIENGIVCES